MEKVVKYRTNEKVKSIMTSRKAHLKRLMLDSHLPITWTVFADMLSSFIRCLPDAVGELTLCLCLSNLQKRIAQPKLRKQSSYCIRLTSLEWGLPPLMGMAKVVAQRIVTARKAKLVVNFIMHWTDECQ